MKFANTLLFSLLVGFIFAQDNYHNNLQTTLSNDYNLPAGNWVFNNTEVNNYSQISSWGGGQSVINSEGQTFSRLSQVSISGQGNNPWDSGWKINNSSAIQQGDRVLLVFWIRSTTETGAAKLFIEHATDFNKEIYVDVNITPNWVQYFVPFEALSNSYATNGLAFGFHLALQQQVVQIGGFTAINYGKEVAIDQLPNDFNNDLYEGYEEDAPWRAAAAARIEQFRKADLIIEAVTSEGTPISGANFDIQMVRHEFAFGSAITAARIAGNNSQDNNYEDKIINLDGKGHGFNWVVFENDLKWDGWEEEWFVNHNELVNAVSWLRDKDIEIRGHTLVWPGWDNLPDDLQNNANNPDYIWDRIDGRLDEILNYPGLKGNIPEWDVLNEIVTNTSLEPVFANVAGNTTGREIYADIFKRVRELSPETGLYLNDYMTLTLNNTGGGQYDVLKARIQELIDAGAPIDGIGFQGHIGGFPNGIPSVLNTLDDFYSSFGLTAKITEFDMPPIVSEELGAQYLNDFLTAVFSHESINGFLFWNFWDVATWRNPGANLFREDWSQKPAGDTFINLVFNQWWTDMSAQTDETGQLKARVFKGQHEITYICGEETVTEIIDVKQDESITISCNNFPTSTHELDKGPAFSIYPNPTHDFLTVEREEARPAQLNLYNALGIKIWERKLNTTRQLVPLQVPMGVYFVSVRDQNGERFEKVVVR